LLKLKTLFFLLFPLTILSQSVSGIIYDTKTTVKGAKVFNSTQNTLTSTNDEGKFTIKAKRKDTLIFSSIFHEEQRLVITSENINSNLVIELKKIVNTLDEVLLENTPKEKPFVAEEYTNTLQEQIELDRKKNPEKYSTLGSGSPDLFKIIGLIARLLKKKDKFKEDPTVYATYKDFASLFANNAIINEDFLTQELHIKSAYYTLFFDFCHAQDVNMKLFHKNKQLELIELLYTYSKAFHKLLDEAKND